MDVVGHLPPRRLRPRVGGRLAGGVIVPDPAPPFQAHGVVPAGGRRPLEEGEAAARAEEPTGRGVVPLLNTAEQGLPPQRLACLPRHTGARNLRHVYRRGPPRASGRGARVKRSLGGGGGSQGIGTQPASAAFHTGQPKNSTFRNLFFRYCDQTI